MGSFKKALFPRNKISDPLGIFGRDEGIGAGFLPDKMKEALEAAAAATPAPVAEPSVPVMPLRNDVAAVTAKKKSVAVQRGRRGRRSTILTALDDNEGVLGA